MLQQQVFSLVRFFLAITLVISSLDELMAQQYFETLTHQMHLKKPKLTAGEYEIRIWNKQGLRYGDAQMLYVLRKTKRGVDALKYVISWNGQVFNKAKKIKPARPVTDSLWMQLVKQDILTLPDQIAINDRLHPKPKKDSAWNVIEADGSISVKAKRTAVGNILISDGEAYYVEILGDGKHRWYTYSNPKGYYSARPTITELQKVTAILTAIESLFETPN